jgi:signal transduction histidine kinase
MRSKPKSIRSKIIMSLVVPLVALSALWGLGVQASLGDALELRSAYDTRDQVGRPCDLMLQAFQAERSRSQEFLAVTPRNIAPLRAQREATDAAVAEFRRLSSSYDAQGEAAEITRARINDVFTHLDALAQVRTQVDAGTINRTAALTAYSDLISLAFSVLTAAASFGDLAVDHVMRIVMEIRMAGELLSQEDALMTGAATAGRFGNGEYLQLIKIVGALRFQVPAAGASLPEKEQTTYLTMLSNPAFSALLATEDQIIRNGRAGGTVPITLEVWKSTFNPVAKQIFDFLAEGYNIAIAEARAAGNDILLRFSLAGGLGMVAILWSVLLSISIGRSVVDRLSMLRAAAIDLAGRQLPQVIAQLRAGKQITAEHDPLRLPAGDDEIAEVALALGEVRRSAIDSAVSEAALRYGMSKVFVNIARRNQTLLDRQLAALAQLRTSGTAEESHPASQAEQLAIQMRRHAEHLVILAGSARSRGGLRPVPLAKIISGAAGEVEDTERIEARAIIDAEIPGRAAADVVHLLAALMENAIAFSPPDTPVRVSAQRLPHGVVVEIEDRGLGMTQTALEETNRTFTQPPNFDPANSARLGLFVVAQLAAQRGIRVFLQPSNFGGITAVVMLPPELVDEAPRNGPGSTPQPEPAAHRANATGPAGMPATPDPVSAGPAKMRYRFTRQSAAPSASQSPLNRGAHLSGTDGAPAAGQRGQLPRRKRTPGTPPPLV